MAKARLSVAIILFFSLLFLLCHARIQPLKPEDLENIVVEWKSSSSSDLPDSATEPKILLPSEKPKEDSVPKFEGAEVESTDDAAELPSGSDDEKHHHHHDHHHKKHCFPFHLRFRFPFVFHSHCHHHHHKNQSHCHHHHHHHHHKNHTHSEDMEENDQMEEQSESQIAGEARFLHGKGVHDHKPCEKGEEMMGFEEGEMKHQKKPTTAVGGWHAANVTDPQIQEIGIFSISEHNKEAKVDLQFVSVKQAAYQDVSGRKYSSVLIAKDHGVAADYGSIVYENLPKDVKKLIAFKKFQ
ncbi:hypothetical protein NE237_000208 [Protea cynaroides]|uniref:Cystatin domain-containing protein n=1 Tax=Protea cynaroides TaxID=273540 RepID=A0A9Q0QX80_9MAGN|nr:hypothetical protein NE237_000208 [Protea cynaroides]